MYSPEQTARDSKKVLIYLTLMFVVSSYLLGLTPLGRPIELWEIFICLIMGLLCASIAAYHIGVITTTIGDEKRPVLATEVVYTLKAIFPYRPRQDSLPFSMCCVVAATPSGTIVADQFTDWQVRLLEGMEPGGKFQVVPVPDLVQVLTGSERSVRLEPIPEKNP